MRTILKMEEALMFLFGLFLLWPLGLAWWWLLLLFFSPHLGALGYLAGPRIGALTYNLFHHKGLALALYLLGVTSGQSHLVLAGAILFAHSSFDRMLGFGLKHTDSFNNTHLAVIGRSSQTS
ncbi:MAG: DUF4260 family protein [Anaerolineales bacterium]